MPPDMVDKPQGVPANSPGYETRDANVGGVYNFLVILSVILVCTALVCWGLFRFFSASDASDRAATSPFADTRQVPMGVQLQVNPREEWLKYRGEQERALESFAWENKANGIVRVPIEQAMDILMKKGLPVQGETSAPAAEKSSTPAAQGRKKP
jgi:hypothetical protein